MKTATMTPVYAVLYAKMAEAARSCGYALAVHGSMARDLDVVAIPWTEEATSADEVVRAMAAVAARRAGDDPIIGYQMSTAPRPHGRVGYSFPFASTDGFDPDGYVDVSVMPRVGLPAGVREALEDAQAVLTDGGLARCFCASGFICSVCKARESVLDALALVPASAPHPHDDPGPGPAEEE